MNFLLGAMIIDCITNSEKDTSENGAGVLFSIGLFIYIIVKLPTIEKYILNIASKDINLLGALVIGFFLLIPIYWAHSDKYKSLLIRFMLRIMLYLDVSAGIGLMVYLCNVIGSYPASFLFNISKVAYYGQSSNFFISLFASIAYMIIKVLDFSSIVGLVPLMQIVFSIVFKKIRNIW